MRQVNIALLALLGIAAASAGIATASTSPTPVTNIAALKALGANSPNVGQAAVASYYSGGLGGGLFKWAAACPAAPDGGIYISATGVANGCWVRQVSVQVSDYDYGAIINGTTDNSAQVAATIVGAAAAHVTAYIAPNSVFTNVVMTSAQNGANVIIDHALHKVDAAGAPTVALVMNAVSNATVNILYFDGQRTLQPVSEFIHTLAVYGGSGDSFPVINCRETEGDCVYISNSDGTKTWGQPTGHKFGALTAINSVPSGRNGISIVAGTGLSFGSVACHNQSGIVGATHEPGCVDLEPNSFAQKVNNIVFASIVAYCGGGAACLSINGNDVGGAYDVTNIAFQSVTLTCAGVQLCGHLAAAGNVKLVFSGSAPNAAAYGTNDGIQIDDINGLSGTIATNGLMTNYLGALLNLNAVKMTVSVTNYGAASSCAAGYGLQIGKLTNSTIAGQLGTPGNSCPAAGVYERSDGVLNAVTLGVSIAGTASYPVLGYNNAGGSNTNVTLSNVACTGMTDTRCTGSFPTAGATH